MLALREREQLPAVRRARHWLRAVARPAAGRALARPALPVWGPAAEPRTMSETRCSAAVVVVVTAGSAVQGAAREAGSPAPATIRMAVAAAPTRHRSAACAWPAAAGAVW
ncbi:MAG TPA: hypothetical protein VGB82_02675 [Alphaproteobacteria bacterium]